MPTSGSQVNESTRTGTFSNSPPFKSITAATVLPTTAHVANCDIAPVFYNANYYVSPNNVPFVPENQVLLRSATHPMRSCPNPSIKQLLLTRHESRSGNF